MFDFSVKFLMFAVLAPGAHSLDLRVLQLQARQESLLAYFHTGFITC